MKSNSIKNNLVIISLINYLVVLSIAYNSVDDVTLMLKSSQVGVVVPQSIEERSIANNLNQVILTMIITMKYQLNHINHKHNTYNTSFIIYHSQYIPYIPQIHHIHPKNTTHGPPLSHTKFVLIFTLSKPAHSYTHYAPDPPNNDRITRERNPNRGN